ncbi:hypothetical protein D9M69_564980 [compost metagenome]
MKIFDNLLGAVGLIQPGHMIDELACHKARRLHRLESAVRPDAEAREIAAGYVGEIERGSKHHRTDFTDHSHCESEAPIFSWPKINETGRGYFRHPVSPLATTRESFLPFTEWPASYA